MSLGLLTKSALAVSLLVGCAESVLWARSFFYYDAFAVNDSWDNFPTIISYRGYQLWSVTQRAEWRPFRPTRYSGALPDRYAASDWKNFRDHCFAKCAGFGIIRRSGATRGYGVFVPDWLLVGLASLLPVRLILRLQRRKRWIGGGMCSFCGYDLRSTSLRCPECGQSIATGEH